MPQAPQFCGSLSRFTHWLAPAPPLQHARAGPQVGLHVLAPSMAAPSLENASMGDPSEAPPPSIDASGVVIVTADPPQCQSNVRRADAPTIEEKREFIRA